MEQTRVWRHCNAAVDNVALPSILWIGDDHRYNCRMRAAAVPENAKSLFISICFDARMNHHSLTVYSQKCVESKDCTFWKVKYSPRKCHCWIQNPPICASQLWIGWPRARIPTAALWGHAWSSTWSALSPSAMAVWCAVWCWTGTTECCTHNDIAGGMTSEWWASHWHHAHWATMEGSNMSIRWNPIQKWTWSCEREQSLYWGNGESKVSDTIWPIVSKCCLLVQISFCKCWCD